MSVLKLLIIEDEPPAVRRLRQLLNNLEGEFTIVKVIDTVEESIAYLTSDCDEIDLVFMDIQLADGLSFEIIDAVPRTPPIIFTTAYDEFMLQAFKAHSIDYLLKPIDVKDMEQALNKFHSLVVKDKVGHASQVDQLSMSVLNQKIKKRFLVKQGQQLRVIATKDVKYFYSEDGYAHLMSKDGRKYIVEFTMDQLSQMLPADKFFRINRKFVVNIDSVVEINPYFNSRLTLKLEPQFTDHVIVSRERVSDFKQWLDS